MLMKMYLIWINYIYMFFPETEGRPDHFRLEKTAGSGVLVFFELTLYSSWLTEMNEVISQVTQQSYGNVVVCAVCRHRYLRLLVRFLASWKCRVVVLDSFCQL